MAKRKFYVGLSASGSLRRWLFNDVEPIKNNHGDQYVAIIGPFATKRGAIFMRDYGEGNPHCQTVSDAERLAKRKFLMADIYVLDKPISFDHPAMAVNGSSYGRQIKSDRIIVTTNEPGRATLEVAKKNNIVIIVGKVAEIDD